MTKLIKTFFASEIAVGICLLLATAAALLICNSPQIAIYEEFFATEFFYHLNFREFVNDCLMAFFFLLVGLELKKEMLIGELSSAKKFSLPFITACGGVIAPILIYYFFNRDFTQNLRGFAIPCATDIAFAYGIIALFGKQISLPLKVFVVALAVIDDLMAILIIVIFYSAKLDSTYLYLSGALLAVLALMNSFSIKRIFPYLLVGLPLWFCVWHSGIHASIAGFLLSLFVPLRMEGESPLVRLARSIAPMVNFFILPLFAFANAGVHIQNFSAESLNQPVVLGIALGLFFGKQIGVMLFGVLAVKFKIAVLPSGANWMEFYKASIFTAIGFTMSLFIASLAFADYLLLFNEAKIGILLGSFAAMLFAAMVIFIFRKK